MMRAKDILLGALLLVAAPLIAMAQGVAPPVAPAPGAAAPAATSNEYVIGPEDTIEIGVVGTSDRTRARVYTDGTFQMNMIGTVEASGRTPRQLGAEIAQTLQTGGFYSNPVVDVEGVGFASRYVTVLGAVGSPGLVPINRAYHLSEILARVGGVKDGAAEYLIVRSETGPERRYMIDKLAAGDAADDPLVAAGDKIFSPTAEVFYMSGQVKSPGTFPIRSNMTVAQAIAKAGGVTESGSDKSVKISRGGKTLKLGPTAQVEAGDVVTVAERLF